jgi:hypothetical protein
VITLPAVSAVSDEQSILYSANDATVDRQFIRVSHLTYNSHFCQRDSRVKLDCYDHCSSAMPFAINAKMRQYSSNVLKFWRCSMRTCFRIPQNWRFSKVQISNRNSNCGRALKLANGKKMSTLDFS